MSEEIKHTQMLSWSKDGKAHIPLAARIELGVFEGEGDACFFASSNLVLLYRKNTNKEELVKSIKVLRDNLLIRLNTEGIKNV